MPGLLLHSETIRWGGSRFLWCPRLASGLMAALLEPPGELWTGRSSPGQGRAGQSRAGQDPTQQPA